MPKTMNPPVHLEDSSRVFCDRFTGFESPCTSDVPIVVVVDNDWEMEGKGRSGREAGNELRFCCFGVKSAGGAAE